MIIVNGTPHAIRIRIDADNSPVALESDIVIAPSGNVARVATTTENMPTVDGIPVSRTVFGAVEGLPEPAEGTIYIVSALVGGRCVGRTDVFGPDTGKTAIRTADGQVFAVRGLQAFA